MTTMQSAIALVGVAKQTAKGTAAAQPVFAHGITDGAIMSLDITQDLEEHTSATRFSPGVNRTEAQPGAEFTCRAHPKTLGLYLYAALGAISTSGAGPYVHVITLGSDLPYLSLFGKMGSEMYRVPDAKVDELKLSWSGNEPLEIALSLLGCEVDVQATWTPTTDESIASYWTPVGGTYQLDIDGTTLAAAPITGGEISIANSAEPVFLSGLITPDDIVVGKQAVDVTLEMTPPNLRDWQTVVTGTSAGTSVSGVPVYGSFSVTFVNGADTLVVACTRVPFLIDFPDSDPAGGAVTVTAVGQVVLPTAGTTPITATVTNTQTTY
jgi:hypothetical protein